MTTTDLIAAHLAWLRASGASPDTIADREYLCRRVDRELAYGLTQASEEEITTWLGTTTWKPRTRHTYFTHLRSFYAWACDPARDGLDWNPMVGLRTPHRPLAVPRPVTDDELARALRMRQPYSLWARLAALAGLRCIEISRTDRDAITETHIHLVGKGGKEMMLETHPDLWAAVKDLPPGPLARSSQTGERLSPSRVSAIASVAFGRAGLRGVTLHRIRHWFATSMLVAGADLRTVQEAMRHSSIQSTQIYTLVTDPRRRAAIRSLHLPG